MAGDNLIGARPRDFEALSDLCKQMHGEVTRETTAIVEGVTSLKEFLGQAQMQFMQNWPEYEEDLRRFPEEIKQSDIEFYSFYDLYKKTDDATLQEWLETYRQRQSPTQGTAGATTPPAGTPGGTAPPSPTAPGAGQTLADKIRQRKQGDAY